MISWKYKNKSYYFDHVKALWIILLLIGVPIAASWFENIKIVFFGNLVDIIYQSLFLIFVFYLVYLNCIVSYVPYYFDENGKKIEGEEPKELKALRCKKR
ncbi:hypothetical protein F889_00494 [Acinetobacter colistiniresistens]|uniref:Uncharacterized protein n=1 Tax=Acinetobacter colistiniresistens TaxID=280145 RepID=N9RB23_9GAMM|nr:hypothetical protein [Acinetobacter colistiniresistens]ENX36332.1 hypothetical protein F889_00494 [Acinetobacter colistiniresistens]